jgi:hypothetical protein
VADVNGDIGEWDLLDDHFAYMYRAADPLKPIQSSLYLRYDCSTSTLYALVLAGESVQVVVDVGPTTLGDAFIKAGIATKLVDGNSDDDGVPPDFGWVGLAGTAGNRYADGWEASAALGPGSYTNLNVHTSVFDDAEQQASAVANRAIDLVIDCTGAEP